MQWQRVEWYATIVTAPANTGRRRPHIHYSRPGRVWAPLHGCPCIGQMQQGQMQQGKNQEHIAIGAQLGVSDSWVAA